MALSIPKGKKLIFSGAIPTELRGKEFLLEEDINAKVESSFKALVDGDAQSAFVLVAESLKSLTGGKINIPEGNKFLGFQQWSGTEPLSFSLAVGVYMETDAYTDVVVPVTALMRMTVPSIQQGASGQFGNYSAPGPSAADVLLGKKRNLISVQIGSMFLSPIVITGIDVNFSQETDTFDHPIFANLRIALKTLYTANDQMIAQMYNTPL